MIRLLAGLLALLLWRFAAWLDLLSHRLAWWATPPEVKAHIIGRRRARERDKIRERERREWN
jgi:hypothetical protein